jgi:hypothetical protein
MTTKRPPVVPEDKRKDCPKCGERLHTCWAGNGRTLRKECHNDECWWKGEPYTPPKRRISSVKTVSYFEGGNWEYELFDQYGHEAVRSQGFSSKEACVTAARRALVVHNADPNYAPCTAIIWPPTVKVVGERVR